MGTWVLKVDTLPRIKTFMWQCMQIAFMSVNALFKDTLVIQADALSVKGKSRHSYTDLEIMRRPKPHGADWEYPKTAAFMRVISTVGSKRIAKTTIVD